MTLERLVERLRDFGFTRDEAEIYVLLLRAGPCPARVVARRFEISRMKAYRALKELEERGLVHRIMGRPVRFVAAPLKETLDRHIDEVRGRLERLEEGEREITESWERLSRRVEPSLEEPRFRIFQGRQQIYDLIQKMGERAAKEVIVLTTANDLTRLSLLGIDDDLKALASRGTQVRVLTPVVKENLGDVEVLLDSVEVRSASLPAPMRIVVVDDNEALTTVAMDDTMSVTTQDDTGLWTNASSYIKAMKVFLEALWGMAPEAGVVIESIKTGREPQEIRIITTRRAFVETFSGMIEQSESTIDMVVERIRDLPVSLRFLMDRAERDLRIRLLTQVDIESLNDVKAVSESVVVKHRAVSEFMLVIVDNGEVVLRLPGWRVAGYAIWSNLKAYVDTMSQVFEGYWEEGSPTEEVISNLVGQKQRSETLGIIGDALKNAGWIVESPGYLKGKSGATHPFSLVARRPGAPDEPIAIEVLPEGEVFGSLIEQSVKSSDLKSATIFLETTRGLRREETELAELYGIKLIQAPKARLLAEKTLNEAQSIGKGQRSPS